MDFCVQDVDFSTHEIHLLRALLGFVRAAIENGGERLSSRRGMRHFDIRHAGEWASSLFFATMKNPTREECILNRRSRFERRAAVVLIGIAWPDLLHRRRFIPPVRRILWYQYQSPLHRSCNL